MFAETLSSIKDAHCLVRRALIVLKLDKQYQGFATVEFFKLQLLELFSLCEVRSRISVKVGQSLRSFVLILQARYSPDVFTEYGLCQETDHKW